MPNNRKRVRGTVVQVALNRVLFGPVDQNSTYFPVPASKDSTDETKFTVRPRELGEGNAPDWLRSKATRHFVSVMTDAESATTYRQTHKDCHLYKLKPEYEVSAPLFPFEHRNGGHWTIQDKIKFLSYWILPEEFVSAPDTAPAHDSQSSWNSEHKSRNYHSNQSQPAGAPSLHTALTAFSTASKAVFDAAEYSADPRVAGLARDIKPAAEFVINASHTSINRVMLANPLMQMHRTVPDLPEELTFQRYTPAPLPSGSSVGAFNHGAAHSSHHSFVEATQNQGMDVYQHSFPGSHQNGVPAVHQEIWVRSNSATPYPMVVPTLTLNRMGSGDMNIDS